MFKWHACYCASFVKTSAVRYTTVPQPNYSEIQWWFHWWHVELVMYFILLLFLITLLSIHHDAWIIFGGQKERKKRIFTVWLSKTHLVEDCLLAAVCGRFSQMKSLSAVSPYSRPTPESFWIVWTQSRYEFVTSRHFIWGCRQSFLTKRRGGCKLRSARFSFLQPFSKN